MNTQHSVSVPHQHCSDSTPSAFGGYGGYGSRHIGSHESAPKIRLCVITTTGASVQVLYAGRLEYLSEDCFEITVICAPSGLDEAIVARGVRLLTVPFTRTLSPWRDLRALVRLYLVLREERFDLVEVGTPKAAFIGSLAAWLARCRHRSHVLHGAPYEGKRGPLGFLLRVTTLLPCLLSDLTLAVSPSLAGRVCADGRGVLKNVRVLGAGSANGVDVERFAPSARRDGHLTRARCRIPADAVVIGFVGRLTRDKGVDELAESFKTISQRVPNVVLLLVGDYEERDRPSNTTIDLISAHPGVRHVGLQGDVVPFMAAMDIVVLPTHREGLGNVLLEAAAMAIPTVSTNATGARDAVVDGKTGLLVPVGDVQALNRALMSFVSDSRLRSAMGETGRQWVTEQFEQKAVWRRQSEAYRALLTHSV